MARAGAQTGRNPKGSIEFLTAEARRAGYAAAMQRKGRAANPFDEGVEPDQHQAWNRDWNDCEADRAGRPRRPEGTA